MDALEAWLISIGFAEHVPAFHAHRVTFSQLAGLTDEDLRELGLVIGDRKRLRAALAQCDTRPPSVPVPREETAHPLLALPERRPLTVAFIDLVDSTGLAAQLEPEDLLEILRRYREACTGAVLRYGGHVAQFVGDGILAYFCYPVAHEDDPERAVLAALEAIANVRLLLVPGGGRLDARAGIATGRVVIGDLFGTGNGGGGDARPALGSALNLAARLQPLAPPGGVVVSAETAAKLGGRFALSDLGRHALKGFTEPQRAFQAIGERRRNLRPRRRGGEGRPSGFVNRDAQLAALHTTWAAALAGHGTAVLLRGEAGIGKSRLVQRFLFTRRTQGLSSTLSIFASPFHRDSPLHPVTEMLRALARIGRDEMVPDLLRRLRRLLPQEGEQPEALAVLAELLGVPGAEEPLCGLAPQRLKALMLNTLAGLATRLAARRPLCLVVEDGHWLDPTSLELLERLLIEVVGRRILLLLTARDGFTLPEAATTGLMTLDLEGLAEADAERMVQVLYSEGALPAPLRQDLVRRSMGVPLFVEELAHTLAGRSGSAAVAAASGRMGEGGVVPVSLQECLAARLDRAGPAKAIAQVAAVLGAPLRPELLAAVADLSEGALREALARLDEAGVLRREIGVGGESWVFRHALLRDAAYGSLVRDRRRALHGRAADALAALPPEAAASAAPSEILAHHLCEAGRAAESLPHWLAAARRSLVRSALAEATRQLRRGLAALDVLPDGPEARERRLELMTLLGPALIGLRGPGSAEAQALYAEAVALCHGQPQRPEHFPIYWGWWRLSRDYHDHRARADSLFAVALARRDRDMLVQAHHCNWAAHFSTGDLCGCERHIRAGLALYSETAHAGHASLYGNHDARVCGLAERSLSLWQRGRPRQAAEEMRRAGDWARRLRHVGSVVHAQDFATMLEVYRRDPAAVAASAGRLAALAEEHGYDDHRARCLIFRGWAMAMAGGDPAAGAAMAEEGLAIEREINTPEDFPIFHCLLAEAQAAGEPERALAGLTAARDEFQGIGLTVWMPEMWRTIGDLTLRVHPAEAIEVAAAAYDEAARLAEAQGAHRLALRALLGRARLVPRLGGQRALAERLAAARMRIVEADEGSDLREAEGPAGCLGAPVARPLAVGCAG